MTLKSLAGSGALEGLKAGLAFEGLSCCVLDDGNLVSKI